MKKYKNYFVVLTIIWLFAFVCVEPCKAQSEEVTMKNVEFMDSDVLVTDGYYLITPWHNGSLAVGVKNDGISNGDLLELQNKTGDAEQTWKVKYIKDGYYSIIHALSGKAMDCGTSKQPGIQLNLWTYYPDATQQHWYIFPDTDGTYTLAPTIDTGLRLDVYNNTMSAGTKIQIWTNNNSAAQKYRLEYVLYPGYAISFQANGGSGAPSAQIKYYDQTLKLSSTKPVRSGYTFLGWSTNKTATSVTYKAGGNYTLNKATVLYAVWKKNEKKSQTITASSVKKIYGDKPFYLKAKTNGNGKLSYSCSNKKVATISSSGKVSLKGYGSAKITVKASATTTYREAVKTVTVKVVPKKVILKSLTSPSRKKIKFSWSKDKTVSGYQVYLCTRKDFKKNTLERRFGKNTVSKTISYMPQKKYYVKVRAYKTVGKKKYYGAWSDVKSVKIQ